MSDSYLVVALNRIPAVDEFLSHLKIKAGGFAAQLFTDVYEQLFTYSRDLRSEYDRYYCVEYPTLAEYLKFAHELDVEPAELEKAHILRIKTSWGVLDESYEENIRKTILDSILEMEASHEA